MERYQKLKVDQRVVWFRYSPSTWGMSKRTGTIVKINDAGDIALVHFEGKGTISVKTEDLRLST